MTVEQQVETGTKLILRVALLAALAYFLFLVRDVVIVVLLAVITAAALSPLIGKLTTRGWSRTAAVIIVYTGLFLLGVAIIAAFLPLFFAELKDFAESWPNYAANLSGWFVGVETYFRAFGVPFDRMELFANVEQNVTHWFTNIFTTTISLFRGLFGVIGYFFLALYLSLEEKGIEKFFLIIAPDEYHGTARALAARMQGKVSQWLFGQMLLMTIAFATYFVGLSLLGVPYALAIALFGGLMELLPYIGPVLAAIPAILVGLLVSPALGFFALLFYVVAHQVEAHIIAPQVMKRSAGLNPVALIVAILVGAELAGPLGIILSVPITMILSVFVEDLVERRQT
jgi:predicted PurR-regulated permease PerM